MDDGNPVIRSSSAASTVHSVEDYNDPLMKDCFQLQQRLIETEKSLQNLQLSQSKTPPRSIIKETTSPQSDRAPILTLADLTPAGSEKGDGESMSLFSSGNSIHLHSSYPKQGNLDKKKSTSNASLNSTSLTDVSSLQKKLSRLREENSTLFLQNNKLMTELENTSFQLQQSREQIKELNDYVQEIEDGDDNSVEALKEELKHKNYALTELEDLVVQLRHHIKEQEEEKEHLQNTTSEKLLQNEETSKILSEKCQVLQDSYDNLVDRESELEKCKKKQEDKISSIQEENSRYKEENHKLKSEIMSVQQKLARVKLELVKAQETSSQCHGIEAENQALKELVQKQQLKLTEYDEEVNKTKEHMIKLESIIQKIQEEKLTGAMSRPDSGIGVYSASETNIKGNDVISTPRSIVAELKLQLAIKESEIHKLQALVSSNAMNQQKLKSDLGLESSNIQGLRSELSSVIENNRLNDKKQVELEQTITRLEEENSKKTNEIVELSERLADKMALLATLETKLNQRNSKFLHLQQELEEMKQNNEDMADKFEKINNANAKERKNTDKEMKELKSVNSVYAEKIIQLESALLAHDEETKATDSLVSRIKSLHAEHCEELQQRIAKLQEQLEAKAVGIVNLKAQVDVKVKEDVNKEIVIKDLQEYINKMEDLLHEKKLLVEKYEEKLGDVQEKLTCESKTVSSLQSSADQYKNELQQLMAQLEETRTEHENIANTKSSEVKGLEITIQRLEKEIALKEKFCGDVEKRYNQSLEMLAQSQKRIGELEDLQSQNEDEIAIMKHSAQEDKNEMEHKFSNVKQALTEANAQVTLYQNQVDELNTTLEEAKQKFIQIAATLKEKDNKIHEQTESLKEKQSIIETMKNLAENLKQQQVEKDKMITGLQDTINTKEGMINSTCKSEEELQNQIASLKEDILTKDEQLETLKEHVNQLTQDCSVKHENMNKMNRMLSLGQDELTIKDNELQDTQTHINNLQAVLEEQQWKIKQKAAEEKGTSQDVDVKNPFTQLEMNFKNERSEFEKKVLLLENNLNLLREDTKIKTHKLDNLSQEYSNLLKHYDEKKVLCGDYEKKFHLQEEGNIQTTTQVQLLKKELESFQMKLRQQIELEEEVKNLRNQLQNIIHDYSNVESQLMVSQQSVVELTRELDEVHSMLSLKEKDCTRLARELGASQVREAQEKSRLNNEFRRSIQDNEFKLTQKSDEVSKLQTRYENDLTTKQQDIMKLQIALQRSQDETRLCKNDLDRYQLRVGELDDDVKKLTQQLQSQEEKGKEMDEAMVIKESEIARFSARLSCYERASLTNRTNKSPSASHQQQQPERSTFKVSDLLPYSNRENCSTSEINVDGKSRRRADSIDDLLRRAQDELDQIKSNDTSVDTTTTLSKSLDTTCSDIHTDSTLQTTL